MTRYISTRGPGEPKDFAQILTAGMAPDGGLYIPESLPVIDRVKIERMTGQSFAEIAFMVLEQFVSKDSIPPNVLRALITHTYEESGVFGHSCVVPLSQIGPSTWLMELYHGPTLAFKDVALQLLGHLFDYVLEQRGERMTLIGATSGDTGSAAIEACRNCAHVDIVILHPHGRVSEVQRRQMTTVDSPNVHNLAVKGTFDDCQALVKAMFADAPFRYAMRLGAVNSINWARIIAQSVYYFSSAAALGGPDRPVSFAVPTGNFGNVYAGWVAAQMGLPVEQLIIGSNRNDILTRFFETGEMRVSQVQPTISPSMDIQISSNFERFLCEIMNRDFKSLAKLMSAFKANGAFRVSPEVHKRARATFSAHRCSEEDTIGMMRACYEETGRLIDPHTAVGLHAALKAANRPDLPLVSLACAHPAKFPDAVEKATGIRPELPERVAGIMTKDEHFTPVDADLDSVKEFIRNHVSV